MGLARDEFTKLWCYLKGQPQTITGAWSFTHLLVNGVAVLTQADLDRVVGTITDARVTGVFAFAAAPSDANPLSLTTQWDILYAPIFKKGKFLVQLLDGDNLQDRPDLGVKRIINRTIPSVPVQTGITLDLPFRPEGRIIIEYLDFPLNAI